MARVGETAPEERSAVATAVLLVVVWLTVLLRVPVHPVVLLVGVALLLVRRRFGLA